MREARRQRGVRPEAYFLGTLGGKLIRKATKPIAKGRAVTQFKLQSLNITVGPLLTQLWSTQKIQ